MSRKHWTIVLIVIGVGIVLQIPGHRAAPDHEHVETLGHPITPDESSGPFRTVTLEVTGMT